MSEFTKRSDGFLERQEAEHLRNMIAAADEVDMQGLHPNAPGGLAVDVVPNSEFTRLEAELDRTQIAEHEDAVAAKQLGAQARQELEVGEPLVLPSAEQAELTAIQQRATKIGVALVSVIAIVDALSLASYVPVALGQADNTSTFVTLLNRWPLALLVLAVVGGSYAVSSGFAVVKGEDHRGRKDWLQLIVGTVAVVLAMVGSIWIRFRANSIEAEAASGFGADQGSLMFFVGLQILLTLLALGAAVIPERLAGRRIAHRRVEMVNAIAERGARAQDFLDNEAIIRSGQGGSLLRIGAAGFAAFRMQLESRSISPEQAAGLAERNRVDFNALGLIPGNGFSLMGGGANHREQIRLGALAAPSERQSGDDDLDETEEQQYDPGDDDGPTPWGGVPGSSGLGDARIPPTPGAATPMPAPTSTGNATVIADLLNPQG